MTFVQQTLLVCFNTWKTEFDERDARLITYLAAHEHTFRHLQLSIRCEAPIYFLARQSASIKLVCHGMK